MYRAVKAPRIGPIRRERRPTAVRPATVNPVSIDWSAVLVGFAVGIVAGLFASALPVVGHVDAGLVAGGVAVDSAIGGATGGLLAG